MKFKLTVILTMFITIACAQPKKRIEVLTLGSFHFNFPNLDLIKSSTEDQIDVFEPKYQREIEEIVRRITKFKPTIIVIEREPAEQTKYDSLFNLYLQGNYNLRRSEIEQLGFRIAKMRGLKKLYCVDAWGRDYEVINTVLDSKDSVEYNKFMNYFHKYSDTLEQYFPKPIFKTKGIQAELIQLNDNSNIKLDLGSYLIGIFKYETNDNEFFGPDYVYGRLQ